MKVIRCILVDIYSRSSKTKTCLLLLSGNLPSIYFLQLYSSAGTNNRHNISSFLSNTNNRPEIFHYIQRVHLQTVQFHSHLCKKLCHIPWMFHSTSKNISLLYYYKYIVFKMLHCSFISGTHYALTPKVVPIHTDSHQQCICCRNCRISKRHFKLVGSYLYTSTTICTKSIDSITCICYSSKEVL